MRSTPQGREIKWDFKRRTRIGGTVTSCPFLSYFGDEINITAGLI
jgi:hypothetical protein